MAAKKKPAKTYAGPKAGLDLVIPAERRRARAEKNAIRSKNKKVASTLKTFSAYASDGGKYKQGSKKYEARLKGLTGGIRQKAVAADKKASSKAPKRPRSMSGK